MEFVHDSEARGVLSHHRDSQLTTEAAVTVSLALHVRVGSLCGAAGPLTGNIAAKDDVKNPAQSRADVLLARLEALSQGRDSKLSGLELVRKVEHLAETHAVKPALKMYLRDLHNNMMSS
jgi:hypothetical protein